MLSHGAWDGTETPLRSDGSEVYSGSLPVVAADGVRVVETYRGDREGGYNYHLMLRATAVGDTFSGSQPEILEHSDLGTVAWDPRLVVVAAATSLDLRQAVFAHASVTDERQVYVARIDERGAVTGFWSRNHGGSLQVPWLEVVATAEGAVVSAFYRRSLEEPMTWHILDVAADGTDPREFDVELALPDVSLTTLNRSIATVVTADGYGAVWRDSVGQAGLVRVGADERLTDTAIELGLPQTSSFSAAIARQNVGVFSCDSGACTLSMLDATGAIVSQTAPFEGAAPTIVAALDERVVTSHLTTSARVVSEWKCL
jgi:hypothetical protein